MRTTLDLDERLIEEARRVARGDSKKAVIEEALREFINMRRRESLIQRIRAGDLGIDLTLEELREMRGCE